MSLLIKAIETRTFILELEMAQDHTYRVISENAEHLTVYKNLDLLTAFKVFDNILFSLEGN